MRRLASSTLASAAFQTSSKDAWKSFCWRWVGSGSSGSGLGKQEASKSASQTRYGTCSILHEQDLGALEGRRRVTRHAVFGFLRHLRLDRLDAFVRKRVARHQSLEQDGLGATLVLDVLEHRHHRVGIVAG